MVLSITTNTSAINVQRNLAKANEESASSLAKLSSGSRVPTAKDDAASLAIGSRVEAEIAGLEQASINASQATSLLQIADGAFGEINDILVRQSTLAIQSSSGQLSDSERVILDSEFQQLTEEIDRIAADTEFNGNQLIQGDVAVTAGTSTAGVVIEDSTVEGALDVTYDQASKTFTVNVDGASVGTYDATADFAAGGEFKFEVGGVSLAIDSATFDGSTDITTGNAAGTAANSGKTAFDFKVGTGTAAEDTINVSVNAANTKALGTDALKVDTQADADAAIDGVKSAIDTLQQSRASVGASLSRLDFASSNLSVAIENQSAAKAGLMDVDVATETTEFASKQVVVQAGVSLLAQANQQPNQLLKLLG